MTTLKDALQNAGVNLTPEEELEEQEQRELKHRLKTILERPKEEVSLIAITEEPFERKKYQKDPTDDLLKVPAGLSHVGFTTWLVSIAPEAKTGYIIWCADTLDTWIAPTKLCLDQNFIYRSDLEICEYGDPEAAWSFYDKTGANVNPGFVSRKTCYLVDNPAAETYEVYYDSTYLAQKYGKTTPNGMFPHKYMNRFHRDMAIMELDQLYTSAGQHDAKNLVKKNLGPKDAIVVSDGCFMKNACASSCYYLDNVTLIHMTQGLIPTEPEQAVLISELSGAMNALKLCYMNKKTNITYYYDNTSIVNVFRNRKTEYIEEVKAYKELVDKMDKEGYSIVYVELHPKTGEERIDANKALMFFHNYCDKSCEEMINIFTKDYRSIAQSDDSKGKSYKQVREEFKPKGRPGQGGNGRGVQNNSRNGNNSYGRRF